MSEITSQIKLYLNCEILPQRMFKVDSISTYLNSMSSSNKITISNFQYVKHQLEMSIKIDLSKVSQTIWNPTQLNLEYTIFDNLNYCSIQHTSQSAPIVYYFIVDKKWISYNTIQLFLRMDTLNSFVDTTYLQLSDKTKILRQHKDRWQKSGTDMWPLIDLYSENVNPQLYGGNEITLNESAEWANQDWFLVYRNHEEPSEDLLVNPVSCYLVPNSDFYISSFDTLHCDINYYNWVQAFTDYPPSTYLTKFYFVGKFNPALLITLRNKNGTSLGTLSTSSGTRYIRVAKETSTGPIKIQLYSRDGSAIGTGWEMTDDENETTKVFKMEITGLNVIKVATDIGDFDVVKESQLYYEANASVPVYYNYTTTSTTTETDFIYISPLSSIDKTRAELIKIIELPYSPQSFYVSNDGTSSGIKTYGLTDANWGTSWVSGMGGVIVLYYLGLDLQRRLQFLASSNDNPYKPLYKRLLSSIDITALKSADNEPKLYHSDFYQPKIYYDSFGFIINLEKITTYKDATLDMWSSLRIDYRATSTINSRFAFKMVDYVCNNLETQDYNNIFVVARNNEIPIYNQQYINYLRAGYNYDVKSKQRTEAISWLGVGLSAIGTAASFASSVYTGGIGIASGVAMATATASQIANAVKTTADAEQNFEAKQKQLQMQATSVYGSDDVDLMDFYAGNRLRLKTYKVSERMKKALFDLFFYCGYIHNVIGLPNTTSRTRFNFIQAEPIFKLTPNLPQEIVNDIVEKYKTGFTYLHYYNSEWDWEQTKENWETSLLGE